MRKCNIFGRIFVSAIFVFRQKIERHDFLAARLYRVSFSVAAEIRIRCIRYVNRWTDQIVRDVFVGRRRRQSTSNWSGRRTIESSTIVVFRFSSVSTYLDSSVRSDFTSKRSRTTCKFFWFLTVSIIFRITFAFVRANLGAFRNWEKKKTISSTTKKKRNFRRRPKMNDDDVKNEINENHPKKTTSKTKNLLVLWFSSEKCF